MKRLLLVLALLLAPAAAWARPPVWTVHGKGATLVLFGSVHILPRDISWEPEPLRTALAQADELWFETPTDAAALLDASRTALAQGMLAPGESLQAQMTPKGRERLKAVAGRLNVPLAQLDRLKPWLAELTIGEADAARQGDTADQGVERQLAEAAPQAQRRTFETPRQQIAMLAGASIADQVVSLEDSLRQIQDDPDQTRRLIKAWLSGDLKAIDREGIQQLRAVSPALYKALLTDRNAAWIRTLAARLDAEPSHPGRPDRIVVVVGIGHLIGAGGLPQLLRARGLRVDGPRS